jgi:hypothetical protein
LGLLAVGLGRLLLSVCTNPLGCRSADAANRNNDLQVFILSEKQSENEAVSSQDSLNDTLKVLVLPFLHQSFAIGELVASVDTAAFGSGPNTLAFGSGVILQCAEALEHGNGLFCVVTSLAGFFADTAPSLLDADLGQRHFEAGEFDLAIFALGVGDGIKSLELDHLADKELAEEFPGLEGVSLWRRKSQ